jgi:HEAT repeat protein
MIDLGVVSAAAAADYFLQVAERSQGRASDRAITAAVLADSTSVWRRLLAIARDDASRPKQTRREAMFWLGQFAAAKLDGQPEEIGSEGDDDRDDARSSAVFALSQLRNKEGIEPLVQVARTSKEAHIRRKALFWLGDSGDPRAVELFGEILGR